MSLKQNFKNLKKEGNKLVIVTSYDYWSSKILSDTNVDGILIGDCASMIMHGYEDTLNCDVDIIAMHTRAVKRGAPNKFLIAAMPFMANRKGLKNAMDNVELLIKAGANAIKIEGVEGNEQLIKHLSESGIPVIGHVGLTPSHHNMVGGFKVQGKTLETETKIVNDAKLLEKLGCVSVVVEAVPAHVGRAVTEAISIPAVGVGAGIHMDGQALVLQDMLGMCVDFKPKFVRTYMPGADLFKKAINQFTADIHSEEFPSLKETYAPSKKQLLSVA